MAVYVRVPGELRLPDWECPGQVADTIKLDGLGRGEWVGVLQPCPPTSGAVLVRGWVRLHRGTEPQVLDSYWPLGGEPVDFAAPVRLAEPIRHTVEVHGTILRLRRHPGLEVSTYRRQ